MHCKEKGSGKGQVGGEVSPPPLPTSQYDPDPTQSGTIFTRIPDFNNFHGTAVPSAPSFTGPGVFTSNTLQMRSGGITGQHGTGCWRGGSGCTPEVLGCGGDPGAHHCPLRVPQVVA